MAEKRSVLLCGQSLCMAGLAYNLRNDAEFAVTAVAGPGKVGPATKEQFAAIFFDTRELSLEKTAALATAYPGVPLIGLNPENSAVFTFSCQKDQAETVNDLKKMITAATHPGTTVFSS